VYFDDLIAQSSEPSKPSGAPKAPAKPTKSATKPTAKPTAQSTAPTTKSTIEPEPSVELKSFIESKRSIKRSIKASTKVSTKVSTEASTEAPTLDLIEELCSQTEALDIKVKKKVKAEEVVRLTKLGLKGIIEEVKSITDIPFEPLSLGDHRESKMVNIPPNINPADPLTLLDLFIPLKMYAIIAENTNLYAITKNAPTTRSSTNTRY